MRANGLLSKAFSHTLLLIWIGFSILPFVWAIIGSFQTQRDALAREPRYLPQFLVENAAPVAAAIALLAFAVVLWNRRRGLQAAAAARGERAEIGLSGVFGAAVVGVVVFLFVVIFPTLVPQDNTFMPIWDNYRELWLNSDVEDFIPVGVGLIALVGVLGVVGFNARALPISRAYVYVGIVAIVVLVILTLPNFVRFAEFYDYFRNSIIVTVGTVVVSITIGCLAGYGLARFTGVDGVIILFVALAFRALPRMAFVLPYFTFAQISGLYDTYFLLIITLVAVNQPFTIWLLRSFFEDIPRELEEAAMIDGCSRLGAFVRVIIPIVWPGIITTALFTLLLAYNEFLIARILTSSNWTLPVGIARFTSGEDTRYIALSNASAVSITIPIVFIVIFFQRYLIKGLAGGAVKG